jgi:hypothetical protein
MSKFTRFITFQIGVCDNNFDIRSGYGMPWAEDRVVQRRCALGRRDYAYRVTVLQGIVPVQSGQETPVIDEL